MQLEPYENQEGCRIWLNNDERRDTLSTVNERPVRKLAYRGMNHGLRSDELGYLTTANIYQLNAETEAYVLRVRDGKTGYREVPVSRELVTEARALQNAREARKEDTLIDVTTRTVGRWIDETAETLAERDDYSEEILHLTPHDLRRTWATTTFYKLATERAGDMAETVLLEWGGWKDPATFREHYLGKPTEPQTADLMEAANLL